MCLSKFWFCVLFGLSLVVPGCGDGSIALDNPKDAATRPSEEQLKKMHEEEAEREAAQLQRKK